MKIILCTGAGGSATNNFIRSLRLANEQVYIVGTDSSKYYIHLSQADKNYIVPKYTEPDYINALNKIIEDEKIEFLHCQPDTELATISENRNLLNVNHFLPKHETILLALDKMKCNKKLESYHIPVATSWLIRNREDLKNALVMLNYQKSWLRATKGAGSLAALPITSVEQGVMWIEYWTTRGITWGEFMLSEYLPGKEYAFQSLWKDGKLITSMARERIEYLFANRMPSGQSSTPTIAKTVHNDKVNMIAYTAVKALDINASGIFCIDLKEDSEGIPCVMEINAGRFFTTSIFFATAGCNMPYYYTRLGYKEKLCELAQFNALPPNLYWIRQMDCGERLVKENEL